MSDNVSDKASDAVSDIAIAPPATFVIFGALGDLTRRLLMPALGNLACEKLIAPETTILGISHHDGDDEALRTGLDSLVVDTGMGLRDLADLLQAMREAAGGRGRRVNVPVAAVGVASAKGSTVRWDRERADALFAALREDRPVPLRLDGH